ncbi:MAG: YoaK family protein [Ferrimonas sp.]
MISRLPKWVEVGAFILVLNAGFINAIGLLGFDHQAVSHVSGTATLLGSHLYAGSMFDSWHLTGVLFSFLMGSVTVGFLLHNSTLKLGRHYDTVLILESGLLILSFIFLIDGQYMGHFFASAACGLQNAMVTTYSGAIIRTTHVTGVFTDLGLMLGAVVRGEPFDRRKMTLFLIIIVGFIVGGFLGAWAFQHWDLLSILWPAGLCFMLALVYRLFANMTK